jgi:hypothetical protein
MFYLVVKAAISGLLIALASEIARRSPVWGALVVALPLTSLLTMIWLWRDTQDPARVAALSTGAFWFVLPSLPMFFAIPWLLRHQLSFWAALAIGCAMTIALYLLMTLVAPKLGLRL